MPGERKAAKLCPPEAGEVDLDGVLGQAVLAVAPGDPVAEHGAERAVAVADVEGEADGRAVLDGGPAPLDELVVEGGFDAVVLGLLGDEVGGDAVRDFGSVEQG